jgi:putative endonuclease
MTYTVYVLKSRIDGRLYKGMTENLERRLFEHNSGNQKSTKAFKPWDLVYSKEFDTRDEARNYEKYLKSGVGREFLKVYLNNNGPVA